MARKIYQAVLGLCALSSVASIASAAPVLNSRQPALVHSNIGHLLTNSVTRENFGRRTAGQGRDVPRVAEGARWTVRAGETGNQIAAQLGIKFFQLAFLNPTVRWRFLQVGQTLHIPGDGSSGHIHVVAAGDTGNAIAAANGISFIQLDAFNKNIDWYNLQVGQSLVVPNSRLNVTRLAQLPQIEQADQDADVPASSVNTLVASVVADEDADAEATTSPKEISPFLTPGKARLVRSWLSSRILKARQALNMRPAAPPASVSTAVGTTYTVKPYDTGYKIADQLGIDFGALEKANPGINWVFLQIEQALNVPVGTQVSAGATVPSTSQPIKPVTGQYVTYSGTVGTAQPPYPLMSTWIPFLDLWAMNSANIGTTCVFASGSVPVNTDSENTLLKYNIQSVANETNVHPSFILAVILQESNGCVRVPTTSSWEKVQNPGLMQSFNGRASCNSNDHMDRPCPDYKIKAMIYDGVKGNQNIGMLPALRSGAKVIGSQWPLRGNADSKVNVTAGAQVQSSNNNTQASGKGGVNTGMGVPSIKQTDEAILYYQAARIYNSGSLPDDGDLSSPTRGTRCYVSDVVNRLQGWTGASKSCTLS